MLHKDHNLNEILYKIKVIICHKRPKSLKKILRRAKLFSKITNPKVEKCGRPNWVTCPKLLGGSEFFFKEGQQYKIKFNSTCASANLIVVIRSSSSYQNYMVIEGLSLKRRCTLQRQQIPFVHTHTTAFA